MKSDAKSRMKLIAVRLDALERHVENVRKAPTDEEADASLAASIRAHGLLSPLIVEGSEEGARVIGGGRRLAALRKIVRDGALPPDHPVPCVLVGGPGGLGLDAVIEISLAENSGRQKMHPADEAEAFTALRRAGATDRELAQRFGVSPRTIQRRLRIGRAAPALLEQCRDGKLQLQMLEAAVIEPDHLKQVRAVREAEKTSRRTYQDPVFLLRCILLDGRVEEGSVIGAFTDRKAYEAAGGTVRRDPETGRKWLQEPLCQRLAIDRLDDAAAAERERGWPKVTVGLDVPADFWMDHRRIQGQAGPPKGEPKARLHLSPGFEGAIRRTAGAPRRRTAPAGRESQESARLSRALTRDLRDMRCEIEAAALAEAPADLARDLLVFLLMEDGSTEGFALRSFPRTAASSTIEPAVPACVIRAESRSSGALEGLTAWAREDSAQARWQALRDMPENDRARLLACCAARDLDIDWRSEWRADASVLARMTKSQLIQAAAAALGAQHPEVEVWRGLKKIDLVEALDTALLDGRGHWLPSEVFGEDA